MFYRRTNSTTRVNTFLEHISLGREVEASSNFQLFHPQSKNLIRTNTNNSYINQTPLLIYYLHPALVSPLPIPIDFLQNT